MNPSISSSTSWPDSEDLYTMGMRNHFSRASYVALHPSNEIFPVNRTKRIGLVGRHNNAVVLLEVGHNTIHSLELWEGA
jgi:hypothetical protein